MTIFYKNKPVLSETFTIAGPKEAEGPLKKYIHRKEKDDMFNEESFEKAECKFLKTALKSCIEKAALNENDIDCVIAGDLLNQIISSSFAARELNIPFLGVYNACSTMTEAYLLAGVLVDGSYMNKVLCGTSSHFSSAERQYRYPLELGSTRPPLSQWTVTGAGAGLITSSGKGPYLYAATVGKVVDYGVKDVNNMGPAMAPAAVDTLIRHLKGTCSKSSDYDLIVTGDLGAFGSRIFKDLAWEKGIDVSANHVDCGEMVFNINEKEFQGGSGAGCSAVVFNSYIYGKLLKKTLKRVLFMATGALLSTVSSQQGESIPSICHAVEFRGE